MIPKSKLISVTAQKVRRKYGPWIRRYAGPEIAGTVTALTAAWLVQRVTHSLVAAAVAGSVAETVGYYGYAGAREFIQQYRRHRDHPRWKRLFLTSGKAMRDLLVEFGPGEVIDSAFLRPFLMYIFPLLLNNFALGIVLGKLAADVVFYSSAVFMHKLKFKLFYPKENL